MAPLRSRRKTNNRQIQISRQKFLEVRDEPDFHSLIAIGRILNALTFTGQITKEIDAEVKTAKGRRARIKNFQITASYLHEALLVFASLRHRYGSEPFFEKAFELIYPKDPNNRNAKILKLIRHSSGFHLDHEQKATKATLEKLDLEEYVILSGDGAQRGDLCVDIADTIDLNYWIDQFKGERAESEAFLEIAQAVGQTVREAMDACDEILLALLTKLDLIPASAP